MYWADRGVYSLEWSPRSELACQMLQNTNLDLVVEFGCGPNESFSRPFNLSNKKEARYIGTDAVAWSPDIIKVDLSSEVDFENLKSYIAEIGVNQQKCAVLLGVLEYINDLPQVLSKLSKIFDFLLFSYCCRENDIPTTNRWINSYNEEQIFKLIDLCEFEIIETRTYESFQDFTQVIFKCQKIMF